MEVAQTLTMCFRFHVSTLVWQPSCAVTSWLFRIGQIEEITIIKRERMRYFYPVCWLYPKEPESISLIDSGCSIFDSTELHTMTESSYLHSSLFYFESKWVCQWKVVNMQSAYPLKWERRSSTGKKFPSTCCLSTRLTCLRIMDTECYQIILSVKDKR